MSNINKNILDSNIELIFEKIIDGIGYRDIAKSLKIKLTVLHDYLSKPEHSARAREALEISASEYDEKAEQVLKDLKPDSTAIEFQKARELAQHYRWKASKRAPKKYGDKMEIEHLGGTKIRVSMKNDES